MKKEKSNIVIFIGICVIIFYIITIKLSVGSNGEFRVIGHFTDASGIYGWNEDSSEVYYSDSEIFIFETSNKSIHVGTVGQNAIEIDFDDKITDGPYYFILHLKDIEEIDLNGRKIELVDDHE